MIAKRVQRKKSTSSFQRLAVYILDTSHQGEKVSCSQVTNCGTDDPELAVLEIQATQAKNRRSKNDKTYHLVVSFRTGERPNHEQLRDIEEHICDAIGLGNHQRLSAVHQDTGNLHLHIAISKVHPESFRCIEPYYDHLRLDAACHELEQRHGLEQDNRIGDARKSRSQAHAMEAHAGAQSLLGWIRENAGPLLTEVRTAGHGWQDLHQVLERFGLELVPRGAGLVVRDRASGLAVKASQVDRQLSAKALIDRWGPYEPPAQMQSEPAPGKLYQKRPLHQHADSTALFAEYQRERDAVLAGRKKAQDELRTELQHAAARLQAWYAERRAHVQRAAHLGRLQKRAEYSRLSAERRVDLAQQRDAARERRARVTAEHPLPTWQEYLQHRAEQDKVSALEVLRSRERRRQALGNAILAASSTIEARHVVLRHLEPRVCKDGVVLYRLGDGSTVRDESRRVAVEQPSTGAVFLALLLAQDRFGDRPLAVEGTDEFKRQVVQVAAVRGVQVRFADPALEASRASSARAQRALFGHAALEVFLEARNQARGKDTLRYRAWSSHDHGVFVYRGRRELTDGTQVALLERGSELLVKRIAPVATAETDRWSASQTVHIDKHGHFIEPTSHGQGLQR